MRPSKTRSSEQLTADAKRNFLFVSESTSGNAQDVTEKLDQGLLDFGLLVEPVDKLKYEFVELPAKDTWGLLVRKDHPLAKKGFVTVSDLEKIPLLASRQTMMMREFSGLLGRDPHSLNVIATYNLLYNASVFVEQGLGAALCLEGLLNTGGKSKPAAAFLQSLKQELGIE